MTTATESVCVELLRKLMASNGWIVSHDAETNRATIVFGAIPNEGGKVGDELARVRGLLFPPEGA